MIDSIFDWIDIVDESFWTYFGIPALVLFGVYFSVKSGLFQVRKFPAIMRMFYTFIGQGKTATRGVPALHAFFASIGGCIGIGNVVGVATAVQIGGPGAVFWMWVAAFLGMLVKYAEIYLGVKYRIKNAQNGYDGGPMIYLQRVFKSPWVPRVICILLCVYGVEIYMFRIITHSMVSTWNLNQFMVIGGLLAFILFVGRGGVRLVGRVSSLLIPVFLVMFSGMGLWVIVKHIDQIPGLLKLIVSSAFSGHAAVGAFAGATVMATIFRGVQRACYTGDIGVGYASVIHAETEEARPEKQASLGIVGIFLDTFVICTFSVFLILLTGVWNQGFHEDVVVAHALGHYFPYVDLVWPIFIFLLGYSSLIGFFAVGRKAAIFLSPKYGDRIYFWYAVAAFLFFSFIGTESQILTIMSIAGTLLLVLNIWGMFKLRDEIRFGIDNE